MKNLFAAAILSSAVLAAPAHAVSFVATNGSAEVFAASARGAQVTFEAPAATGFSVTGGNTRSGNEWNVGANPFGAPDANTYMYVLAGGTATIAAIASAYQSISFYMGSIDSGNQVEVLGAGGKVLKTYSGSVLSDPAAATGDQTSVATNRLLTFSAGANEQLTGLRFTSSVNSLELDNVRFSAAVPEPATWAMMILGFGVVGYSMRRRPQARPQAI